MNEKPAFDLLESKYFMKNTLVPTKLEYKILLTGKNESR